MTSVLIVDDKEDNRYYLQMLLQGSGYEVIEACHGAEALVKARQQSPDVVISDLLMPVMDGYTLLRHWKNDNLLKRIPFIVYTATYTEPEDEQLALSLGADAFILKPAEPEDFIARLRDVEMHVARGIPSQVGATSEDNLLKVYSETLIRKLEEKTLQLEQANRELERDIARRKEAEDKIEHLAFYDPLTNLPNRRLMLDRLQHSFAANARHPMHSALLFIDLDHFKNLNDTKGHNCGDELLKMVGVRLQSCVREGDTVARLGGDEFVVILENLSESVEPAAAQAEAVGEKILNAIKQPFHLLGEDYYCTASIGASLYYKQDMTAEELIRRADTAMYEAKAKGRNTLRFFDPVMQATLQARLQLENDLHKALAEGQFKLHLQPQVNAAGEVLGAEALIRWLSPNGLVSPLQFIPLAEETGLIVPIGCWVIEAACDLLLEWAQDPRMAHLQLAVNVSAKQFRQHDFIEQILGTIISKQVNPERLKLELTESVVLDDIEDTINKMNVLKEAGLSFSMDDFGTGYSSLSYLAELPLQQLKIDQSFVRGISSNPINAIIVQTVIGMANNLDIESIAEGVETETQFQFLKAHGCKLFQGYYFGRPVPAENFQVGTLHPITFMLGS
ncbi:diguanylate cyclase [Novimethylophilus kurashikiensis]|uniref:Diguanylate cyclase n=1 Tax=Novimethylophilus kurashikiensis TaxID=1825523 RepID=A0A2R5FBK4_9PROT|nr:GGDEF domain-containing response regulator [Novimethylophilus kurashikiensis]GBG14071.1 diguanylate cyclase [Novimethylophilus kurashikiensis]